MKRHEEHILYCTQCRKLMGSGSFRCQICGGTERVHSILIPMCDGEIDTVEVARQLDTAKRRVARGMAP